MSEITYNFDNAPTGSAGTSESDPYFPTTYNDLLAAIQSTDNLYVKLNKDFDFKQSAEYKYGLSGNIVPRCTKLFADSKQDGSKYYINGLVVTDMYFMTYSSSLNFEPSFNNIAFLNCVLNSTVSSTRYDGTFIYANSSYKIEFTNCQFSCLIKSGYGIAFCTQCKLYNCSAYIKCVSSTSVSGGSYSYVVNGSTQGDIDGCTFFIYQNRLTEIGEFATKLQNSTVYTTINFYGNSDKQVYTSNTKHCCIIVDINNHDSGHANYNANFMYNSGVTIIDKELIESSGSSISGSSSGVNFLTTQQMKDENYLIDIGFLP